jgi:hypothetical protein|tara:strand:- start:1842 stop:2204 length:363 start_codon:yes stop_codon:yes gene_type:complete
MLSIKELNNAKIYVDLDHLANLIHDVGLSDSAPRNEDGEISLPYAIALICGMPIKTASDDFDVLIDMVPRKFVSRFIMCWDAIEMQVHEDIVLWSEEVGKDQTVKEIRSLAREIEYYGVK